MEMRCCGDRPPAPSSAPRRAAGTRRSAYSPSAKEASEALSDPRCSQALIRKKSSSSWSRSRSSEGRRWA